nr:B295 [uncultured bacterium]
MTAPAQNRWMLLNILRLSGIIIACVGLVIWRKGIGGYQDELVGKIIFLVGVFETLMVPALLRRKWRGEARGKDAANR